MDKINSTVKFKIKTPILKTNAFDFLVKKLRKAQLKLLTLILLLNNRGVAIMIFIKPVYIALSQIICRLNIFGL